MKNILYTLSIILCWLFTACQDDDFSIPKVEEGKEVTFTFSVTIPEAQKASSRSFEEPSIKSLFLVVFEGGYRVETRKAIPVTSWSVSGECGFKVTLNESPNARAIHFIANYFNAADQSQENALGTGTEMSLIGNLITEIKPDEKGNENASPEVFWQRIDFNQGIMNNDATKNLLKKVPLIRNFVQISAQIGTNQDGTLKLNEKIFKLEGFAVINRVNQGYIAPYNTQTGEFDSFGSIVSGTDGITYTPTNYKKMNYAGRVPSSASVLTTTIIGNGDGGLTFNKNPFHMFERKFEETDENHTYVLIKGSYKGQNSSYYKVALTYRDENDTPHNYNLLRNFNYVITINNVTGDGKPSAKEAAEMTGSHNDLSASIETKSYTNISDGYSRFFVSFTDTTLVDNKPIELKFKYIPDITNNSSVNNNVIGFDDDGTDDDDENASDNIVDYVTIPNLVGDVIKSYKISKANDPAPNSDWRTITITPNLGDQKKEQSITLFAGNLSRTINFTLRPKVTMNVVCDPKIVAKEAGKTVNVNIQIPDNISETLFPLEFNIEAVERTLSGTLPVWTGSSITGNGKPTFGYTQELTWEQYTELKESDSDKTDGVVTIICPFTTNIAANASYVYVTNKYFETDYDNFTNPKSFTNLALNNGNTIYRGAGIVVPLKFTTEDATTVTIRTSGLTLKNGATGLTATGEAGVYTYTTTSATTVELDNHFVLAANNTSEVTVTLNAEGYAEASITVTTRRRSYNLEVTGANIYGAGQPVTVTYDNEYGESVTPEVTGLLVSSRAKVESSYVTTAFTGERKVVLPETDVYERAEQKITPNNLVIPARKITGNNNGLDIYTSNPGKKTNPSNKLGNTMTFSNSKNNNWEATKSNLAEDTNLYFRYKSGSSYYVSGPHSLKDVLDKGVTLSFEKQ